MFNLNAMTYFKYSVKSSVCTKKPRIDLLSKTTLDVNNHFNKYIRTIYEINSVILIVTVFRLWYY